MYERDAAVVTEAVRAVVGLGGWYAAAEDCFVEKVEVVFRVEFQRDARSMLFTFLVRRGEFPAFGGYSVPGYHDQVLEAR